MQPRTVDDYFAAYPVACLRSQEGEVGPSCVQLCTYAYEFPDADDVWDKNWYRSALRVTLPAFQAELVTVMLDARGLAAYAANLRTFWAGSRIAVHLEPMEPYLVLDLRRGGEADLMATGQVHYPFWTANTLSFAFACDEASVGHFYDGIVKILQAFPPKA